MQRIRVALTGGGTGGHVYPLIAVARQLRAQAAAAGRDIEIRYYGARDIFSFPIIGEGIRVQTITGSKLRRYASWKNIVDIPRFFWGVLQALWKVYWYMPDVAFSKGGVGALPVMFASRFYRIPVVVHESDTVPGLTNTASSRGARLVEVGWPEAVAAFQKVTRAPVRVVGNPVREEAVRAVDRAEARRVFGLEPERPMLLVIGGSQGSVRINDFIFQNVNELLAKYQIIHQVGVNNYEEYLLRFPDKKLPKGYVVAAYLEQTLAEAYAAADVAITRAGAQTIAELAATGTPSVLIPLPEAAQDHQRHNAYAYAATGAAVVVEEANLLPALMFAQVDKVYGQRAAMAAAAKAFHRPGAAEAIAKDVLEIAGFTP